MDLSSPVKKMKRSRSLSSLVDITEFRCDESEWDTCKCLVDDSGVQSNDGFVNLEKKVDTLNKICLEQTRVLSELTQQVRGYTAPTLDDDQLIDALRVLLEKLVDQRDKNEAGQVDGGARSLLTAIEARPSLERRISDTLTNLLQGEDLKQRIVSSTSASIRELIKSLFSAEVSSLYVPIMERAHRQLLKHVTKLVTAAFADLEESTAFNAEVLHQTSESIQTALQQHQTLLRETCDSTNKLVDAVASTTEKVLERELKQWREDFSGMMPQAISDYDSGRVESPSPASPEQCAIISGNSTLSAVDRIMMTAEITKRIKDGDVNGAFRLALLALDLSLVTAACRAAPAPAPGALAPSVLLSLIQQLATDLVADTQLKCSYIEYALDGLRHCPHEARAHLPRVASELARHAAAFCATYPHHVLTRRIACIVETARSLL